MNCLKSLVIVCLIGLLSACSSNISPIVTSTSQPTEIPTNAPTLTTISTLTPTSIPVVWQKYKMTYLIKIGGSGKLWMPAPRNWEELNGMRNISIVDISPKPNDEYQDEQGNSIVFWNRNGSKEYSITFELDLSPIYYSIDPKKIGEYDFSETEYIRYTQPSSRIESSDTKIIELAKAIVGNETNPYLQAQKIHGWVSNNIKGEGYGGETALTTLEKKSGSCGGHSFLFISLLRALGIPARTIGGLHTAYSGDFENADWKDGNLHTHIWSEFFLQNYGWVQSDTSAGNQNFGEINEKRVVLFRGEDIILGHDYPLDTIPWFHMPQTNTLGNSDPMTQTIGEYLRLAVEKK